MCRKHYLIPSFAGAVYVFDGFWIAKRKCVGADSNNVAVLLVEIKHGRPTHVGVSVAKSPEIGERRKEWAFVFG